MDQGLLIAQIVAAGLVIFGLLGLLVVSIPSNRYRMFGSNSLGRFRTAHGYVTLALLVACGISVWVKPPAAVALASGVCILVLIGKAVDIASGQWRSCKRCVLAGPLVVLTATIVLVLALP